MSDDKQLISSSGPPLPDRLVTDVRAIITARQSQVLKTINEELIRTYWEIGQRIVQEEQQGQERAGYGEQLIERLGRILTEEYGRGYSATNLRAMRLFYLTFPIQQTVSAELSWSHYSLLMRLPDEAQRDFYSKLAIRGRWSVRELDKQIRSQLHLRVLLSRKQNEMLQDVIAPRNEPATTLAETFKDPYILDFLGLADTYSEKDLEAAIIHNMERFLLELGTDFCFVGRQQRINVGGDDYYIDLIFYHRTLRRLILIDLKIGAFEPGDIGQMQLYLEWTKRYNKRPGEKDPVGLILCGSHRQQVIELVTAGQKPKRVWIAQYLSLDDTEAIKRHFGQVAQAVEQLQEGKDKDE